MFEGVSGALFSAWASWWAVPSIEGLRFYFEGGCQLRVCPTAWSPTFPIRLLALGKLNYEIWKPSVAGCERLLLLLYPVPVKQSSFCKYFDKLWALINVFLPCNSLDMALFPILSQGLARVSFQVPGCYELSYNLFMPTLGQGEAFQFKAAWKNCKTGFVLL